MSFTEPSLILKVPTSEKNSSQIVETNEIKQEDKDQDLLNEVKLDRCSLWVLDQSKFINSYDQITDDSKIIAQNNKLKIDTEKPGQKRKIKKSKSENNENNIDSDTSPKPKRTMYVAPASITLECEWKHCRFSTDNYETFIRHVRNHMHQLPVKSTNENGAFYSCAWDICDFETSDEKTIVRHVNFHSYHTRLKSVGLDARDKLELPRCVQDSSNRNTIPEYEDAFTCRWRECNDIFQCIQSFIDHMKCHIIALRPINNSSKVSYVCGWRGCKAAKRDVPDLEVHVRTHTGRKLVACPHCGTMFANISRFDGHFRRQLPIEMLNYKCVECHKFYATEALLRDHTRIHVHFYKCSFCEMTTTLPIRLTDHIRAVHLKDKTFQCHLCDKAFVSKYTLESHMVSHITGPKKYICNEENCDKSFKTSKLLRGHIKRMHEGSMYCCHNCDARYKAGTYLTKHLKKVHGFRWPSGHPRFFYRRGADGFYRLCTTRYECLDINQQVADTSINEKINNPLYNNYKLAQINPTTSTETPTFVIYDANEVPNFKQHSSKEKINPKPKKRRHKKSSSNKVIIKCEKDLFKNNENNITNDEASQTDSNLGSIDDYSVMKRYIKKTNAVVITIDDVDANGKVIKSEVLNSEEIICDSNFTD